ncbi:MAG: hypothetical protein JXB46_11720 [Candidatus Eisenbacteria bacterium]|nr:hypothetical protein [Candidatus Eisenbacteria bacterium]
MLNEVLLVVSPVTAALALAVALMSWFDGRRVSRIGQHYGLVAAADIMLGANQDLLRFHGIDPETIEEEYGVTPAELSYLLQSFNAGSVSYLIASGRRRKTRPFEQGSYRYQMLSNQATQRAFPLIRQLFDSRNPYMSACEATIRVIQRG